MLTHLATTTGNIIFSENLKSSLLELLDRYTNDKIFLLVDENTFKYCYPKIADIKQFGADNIILIQSGEKHKNIETLTFIWNFLTEHKADRHSLLINLGGGVICDIGGFAAATFKRGIDFINIPTTLLAQVDSSIGGKTGINFLEYKNEIGLFKQAEAVIINGDMLETLDKENMLSGFAEMIKHALLKDENSFNKLINFEINNTNYALLNELVAESIMIKDFFVSADPLEKNIRKALNFGHTIGHALETFSILQRKPILHGYAVAFGMVAELFLSSTLFGFPIDKVTLLADFVKSKYGKFNISHSDFDSIFEIMLHDKKNRNEKICFSLLKQPGEFVVDITCEKSDIIKSLSQLL